MRGRVPAKGDGDDGEDAITVAVTVHALEFVDADKGLGGQGLAVRQDAARVGVGDEPRHLDELDVAREKRRPDAVRLGVAVDVCFRGGWNLLGLFPRRARLLEHVVQNGFLLARAAAGAANA